MQVGVFLPQANAAATRDVVLRSARSAEASGYDALWVNDHVVFPRDDFTSRYPYSRDGRMNPRITGDAWILEPLTELAFAAAATERIALGTAVLVLNMRHPVLHAKVLATLDHLAGGRLILGAGMGWAREEFAVLGMPDDRRGARFEEYVGVLRALWSGEPVEHAGDFVRVDGWISRPTPPRAIPLWLGGDSPRQLERVGRLADGWVAPGHYIDRAAEAAQPAREAAERAGRDPSALTIALGAGALTADGLERVAERVARAREGGVDHAMLGLSPDEIEDAPDLLHRFAEDYLEAARTG